ncbi:hypothetical protein DFS33DRAFT_1293618 [Desarmillaria ectypa]|nr:hypothetical protein DFS33DRAFT_1293618 [Desarmillaria ectypa]
MVLLFCPLLGATLISGALTIDEYHDWYDVVGGAVIGICTALVAFRQTLAAVFDFRFNHLLLPRTTSLFLRKPVPSTGQEPYFSYNMPREYTSAELPFTREGGWGWGQEAYAGAPGDTMALETSGGAEEVQGREVI